MKAEEAKVKAEEILRENCNVGFQKGTGIEWVSSSLESVLQAMEAYHSQYRPSDSEIEKDLLVGANLFGKGQLITRGAAIEYVKKLRDKIFKAEI